MPLVPFEKSIANEAFQISSDLLWDGIAFQMSFEVRGNLADLQGLSGLSSVAADQPTEGLWESTCFEAFFAVENQQSYYEVNLSSAGQWMVFRFDGERTGRQICATFKPTNFKTSLVDGKFVLSAELYLGSVKELIGQILVCTPAVVLRKTDDSVSYWSLRHTQKKPDFHSPAHRILRLVPV